MEQLNALKQKISSLKGSGKHKESYQYLKPLVGKLMEKHWKKGEIFEVMGQEIGIDMAYSTFTHFRQDNLPSLFLPGETSDSYDSLAEYLKQILVKKRREKGFYKPKDTDKKRRKYAEPIPSTSQDEDTHPTLVKIEKIEELEPYKTQISTYLQQDNDGLTMLEILRLQQDHILKEDNDIKQKYHLKLSQLCQQLKKEKNVEVNGDIMSDFLKKTPRYNW